MANGSGWAKPILIGVAIFVLGAVIVGSGTATIANTVAQGRTEVTVSTLKEDVDENSKKTDGIDVMATQISSIQSDVKEILDKMDK